MKKIILITALLVTISSNIFASSIQESNMEYIHWVDKVMAE